MRIISGFAKGRKLCNLPPGCKNIRPTSDKVREALFNIIAQEVKQSIVLDLFAGTGALGLEAISRGASYALFADNAPLALKTIHSNVSLCCPLPKVQLANNTIENNPQINIIKLNLAKKIYIPKIFMPANGFSLIFLDPPYGKGLAQKVLSFLDSSQLMAANCLVVVEEKTGISLPESYNTMSCGDKRNYGDTCIRCYRKV